MGIEKHIGIRPHERKLAKRYAYRFQLPDYELVISRKSGKRVLYMLAIDVNDLEYRIRFDKVAKMRRPKGTQITSKLAYLIYQGDLIHGEGTYDYSEIKEEDIKFSALLPISCETHGVFYKRKASHITDKEGCPSCAENRFKNSRKYHKRMKSEERKIIDAGFKAVRYSKTHDPLILFTALDRQDNNMFTADMTNAIIHLDRIGAKISPSNISKASRYSMKEVKLNLHEIQVIMDGLGID